MTRLERHHAALLARAEAMTLDEKKAHVRASYICPKHHQALLAKMDECRRSSTRDPEPACMLVLGETAAGKSTLAKQYASRYPAKRVDSNAVIPVVMVTIPARATFHSMVQKILWALRDPAALIGSTSDKTIRLLEMLRACKVELLILDEGNHLYDKDTNRVLENTADWVKTLIVDTGIGTVMLGLPRTEAIIARNEQLNRRFSERHLLSPFAYGTEFRDFLEAVDANLPLRERSYLGNDDVALRIHDASDGTIGYVMQLVREAAIAALDEGLERLTMDLLADGFDQFVANNKPKKSNPFL